MELLPGRRLVSIEDFDDGQILAFLTKLFKGDEHKAKDRLDLLRDVRDLLGLSRNPRMLSFIADLPDDQLRQARDHHGEITSAELYRLLLERWLQYEQSRAQPKGAATQLEVPERWEAVTRLAMRLWQTTERTVGLSELTSTVTDTLGELADRQVDLDQAAHAIGSGTLLVRSEEGEFAFVHQSVMEWLVARHAADAIRRGDPNPEILTARKMSILMVDFFLGLLSRDQGRDWANHVRTNPASSDAAKGNALLVLDRLGEQPLSDSQLAGQDLRGASLSSRNLRGADLHDADLSEARLVGSDLTGANLRGASLRRANLNDAVLVDADLTDADLTGARLLGADLRDARLNGTRWRRAALVGAHLGNSALPSSETYGAALPGIDTHPQIPPSLQGSGHATSSAGDLLAVASSDGAIAVIDLLDRSCVGRGR